MAIDDHNPAGAYPTLMFLLRFRAAVLLVATLLPVAAGAALYASGAGVGWAPGGLLCAALVHLVARAGLEVLALITDLLIPR